ncbi:malonate decarboxylase subunit alpha [Sporosarcina sp. P18a]|uniref:malonate decarboxylase subunit alpha n=1 Tax=unclassified Sporosarcina TaxID=2647733 RepID=UPI000C16B671|nr:MULTISPECIES: malonate decarboxylase subunit alpha [unclassified Sporosarcina]PIC69319.1 malonate decarboxylase subunit alpha [Sporosarcina sp. P16b]PIC80746.1 malonate decarboxylase subunit alpha [Sporosarcina sp. P18a]
MTNTTISSWNKRFEKKQQIIESVNKVVDGLIIPTDRIIEALELLIKPGDRVVLEGNNQKQASFLSQSLVMVNPEKIHDLHMIMSSVSRPEHLDIFEEGIAKRIDMSYAGPQSMRIAQMLEDGKLELGDLHTYVELYGRLFVDLIPNVVLVAADKADRQGNLYTGPNTEETPTIVEAAAFSDGIVIVQVNEIVDELPRVDIPSSWVDFIVEADKPYELEPLFTRDPRHITDIQVLQGMMCIRGIYEKHGVQSLNHGIGFNTAAIELLLPTYGESLGLRGKICKNWILNPHPTLIPAIESGWAESIYCFGGELGMEKYVQARRDVFFTGKDGSMRSNRTLAQLAGQYAADLFIGSTLQMDAYGNSSTVTKGRLAGYGGAPNMGHNPGGRRHSTEAWYNMMTSTDELARGKKLVVQVAETYQDANTPVFVERLDAIDVKKQADLAVAPVMIYAEDITHVVTEEGIAYLYKTDSPAERREMIASIAGVTPLGMEHDLEKTQQLRDRGMIAMPEDMNIQRGQANRSLLAAKSIDDLVQWSGGLYEPPARFKSW